MNRFFILLSVVLLLFSYSYAQSGYTVQIRVEDLAWYNFIDNSPEWEGVQ